MLTVLVQKKIRIKKLQFLKIANLKRTKIQNSNNKMIIKIMIIIINLVRIIHMDNVIINKVVNINTIIIITGINFIIRHNISICIHNTIKITIIIKNKNYTNNIRNIKLILHSNKMHQTTIKIKK